MGDEVWHEPRIYKSRRSSKSSRSSNGPRKLTKQQRIRGIREARKGGRLRTSTIERKRRRQRKSAKPRRSKGFGDTLATSLEKFVELNGRAATGICGAGENLFKAFNV